MKMQKHSEASLGKEGHNDYNEEDIGKRKLRNGGSIMYKITCDALFYDLAVSNLGLSAVKNSLTRSYVA